MASSHLLPSYFSRTGSASTAYTPLGHSRGGGGMVPLMDPGNGESNDARTRQMQWAFVAVATLAGVVALVVLATHYHALLAVLDGFAVWVRAHPIGGGIVCILMLMATAFPPVMGYSTILYLCGYIYGFPLGWIPSFIGALIGAIACFYTSRHFLRGWAQRKIARYPAATALRKTIEKRGLALIILIRLAPYPYNFVNLLLATTNVSTRDFAMATAISLPKLLLHTYIGASISSFTDQSPATGGVSAGKTAILVISIAVGLGLTAWLWMRVQRLVREDNLEDDQVEMMANGLGGALVVNGNTAMMDTAVASGSAMGSSPGLWSASSRSTSPLSMTTSPNLPPLPTGAYSFAVPPPPPPPRKGADSGSPLGSTGPTLVKRNSLQ